MTVIMISYKSLAVKITRPSTKFDPTPSIHVVLLTANDASLPEETRAIQASKNLFLSYSTV